MFRFGFKSGRGRGRWQVLRIDGVPLTVDLRALRVRTA